MLAQLIKSFIPASLKREFAEEYNKIVQQSRNKRFFEDFSVPDTLDGRFEMILLFMFLHLKQMKRENAPQESQQYIAEAFFDDMDRSLREIGVGDTGVSHRIKKMAAAFYGRLDAYEKAWDNDAELSIAIKRNIYGTVEDISDDKVSGLINYVKDGKHNAIAA